MIPFQKSFQLFLVFFILLCGTCVFGVHPSGGAPQIKCVEKERQALLNFKQGLTGTNDHFSSWGTKEIQKDCCKWEGVHCHNRTGNVIELDLYGFIQYPPIEFLSGVISPSLLELKYLEHLEFSGFKFSGPIPVFFGSFTRLRYLSLFEVGFQGRIPRELGNLSRLHTLNLGFNYGLFSDNLEWLLPLQSLRNLYLESTDLSNATDWLKSVNKLPLLRELSLQYCQLPHVTPSLMDSIDSFTSLTVLDVSFNNLGSSIYSWLFNYSSSLSDINLSNNSLRGPISDEFSKIVSLVHLDLSWNEIGGIPSYFGNFSSFKSLSIAHNNLSRHLPELMKNLSGRVLSTLEDLDLDSNQISGPLPDTIFKLSSLRKLNLRNNMLTGVLTERIGRLSNLEVLYLGSNHFEGVISESHVLNLSRLQKLDLSLNSHLEFKFQSNWIPPFQLISLNLRNCKIGPHFPKWLQTQKQIFGIDISAAKISREVPNWFNQMSRLEVLNLSNNKINGSLPKLSNLQLIDLSSNDFEGLVPQIAKNIFSLNLSKNKFLGQVTFLCNASYKDLVYLDLSDNHLSGQLPDCWGDFRELAYLNLANNNLSGKIPPSMGFLSRIEALQLRNNSFTGKLPQSWKDSKQLNFIDFGQNRLFGTIPSWIGSNLSNLLVLSLSSNNFSGSIPEYICNLSEIQILDLSENNISGTIPECIRNFSAMTRESSSTQRMGRSFIHFIDIDNVISYTEEAFLTWKGRESRYKNSLESLKIIDLSSNNLIGFIPLEITGLVGLRALNLSRNHLTGILVPKIGELKLLDFLDLSRNRLFGEIPSSICQLSFVGVLNLSCNNFTGRIPWTSHLQTFDASSFEGNPGLCGKPLTKACPGDELPQNPNSDEEEHDEKLIGKEFYVSMAVGFILGFWLVCGTLFLSRSCRHYFFRVLNKIEDWLYIITLLNLAKLKRRLQG